MNSSSLLFRDHKAYLVRDQWDGKKYIYDEREVDSVASYLTLDIAIGRNFTFGDLISFVEKDAALFNDVFAGTLGFFDLHVFLTDAKPPKKIKLGKTGIQHLQISWHAEWHEAHKGSISDDDVEPSFSMWTDFIGIGPYYDKYTKTSDPAQRWSLSFSRMNELVNYPLKLNPEFQVSHWKYEMKDGKSHPSVTQEKAGSQRFTLFDVLQAVFHEISFHGAPVQRDKENKKLTKQTKEVKNWKKNATKDGRDKKTGKKLWYSMEEVMAGWERDLKKKKKKDTLAAPVLAKQYAALLKTHKDPEALPVKKFYMENRGNSAFAEQAEKLNKTYEVSLSMV